MRYFNLTILVFLLFTFLVAQKDSSNVKDKEYKSPFKYIIVGGHSEIEKYVFENADNLEVLIDEKSFNEKNLKTLFKLIKKRFSYKESLRVHVYTSLNQIRTPEENDSLNLWGTKNNIEKFKWAYLTKFGETEEIEYGIPEFIKLKRLTLSKDIED